MRVGGMVAKLRRPIGVVGAELCPRSLALLLAISLSGCSQPKAPPPNILLITLDTTRADRIGAYGYAAARTPVIDQLAKEGVQFERAFAPAPLTLPSHASLLTGLYPAEHGLRTNGAGSLPSEHDTLGELLDRRGYDTGAFLASYVLNRKFGLQQGFRTYDDDLVGAAPTQDSIHRYRDGKLVVDSALKWLQESRQKPFFCWVHLYDPHAPYDQHPDEFADDFLESPYDGEIAYVDRQVGRLMEFARRHPQTVIFVVGDHGEGLGDHSELQHGYTLYHSTLHVPFIVQGVPQAPQNHRVPGPISLVDLFPTVLELAGANVPEGVSGKSLMSALRGESFAGRSCYSMTDDPFLQNGWSPLRSLTTDRWHYVRTAKPELYDLSTDPAELVNLAEQRPEQLEQLEQELSALEGTLTIGKSAAVQLTDAELRALASLGYVGGRRDEAPAEINALIDVKDMLPLNVRTQQAIDLTERKKFDEAEAILTKVVEESPPQHYASRIFLATVYEAKGRFAEAERIYHAVLKDSPANTSALYPLGGLYAEQGKFAEAIAIYEQCLQLQPDSAQPLYNLGLVRARMGELGLAQRDLEEALARDSAFLGASVALGNVYARQGRVEDAIAAYEAELAINPASVEGHVNLAVQLVKVNRTEEARPHLEQAVTMAPENIEARFNLAICCDLLGDRAAAREHVEAVLTRQPDHPGAAAKLKELQRDEK